MSETESARKIRTHPTETRVHNKSLTNTLKGHLAGIHARLLTVLAPYSLPTEKYSGLPVIITYHVDSDALRKSFLPKKLNSFVSDLEHFLIQSLSWHTFTVFLFPSTTIPLPF